MKAGIEAFTMPLADSLDTTVAKDYAHPVAVNGMPSTAHMLDSSFQNFAVVEIQA